MSSGLTSRAWRRLWWLGFLGFLPRVIQGTDVLRVLLLFFLAPLVVDLSSWVRKRREPKDDSARPSEDPLPGPAQRYGEAGLLLRYHLSTVLSLLNPFQLSQTIRQGYGEAAARRRVGKVLPDPTTYRQQARYRLPVRREWLVAGGGVTPETSHSWDLLAQRYAYDLVVADEAGKHHESDGTRKDHYFCYDEPVLAPGDGVVIQVRDGVRDAPWVGTGWVDWLCPDFGGNWVTLQHADTEYSYMAHLIPGSIRVRPGERVRGGQVIALCGNSGHSTEPHLHFQLQDHPDFFRAAGLPIAFSECVVDGEPKTDPVYLQIGMRVRPQQNEAEC